MRSIAKKFFVGVLGASLLFGMNVEAAKSNDQSWNLDDMINPALRDDLSKMQPGELNASTLEESRRKLTPDPKTLPTDANVFVEDVTIIGAGVPDLRVRIYRPKTMLKEYPAILWTHGGGHILGSPEMYETLLLKMAREINCIIVAPDYRLAPENPYPADVNDCYAALKWMTNKKKSRLPIKKDRVAVVGDSAGGGLAVAVAMKARDEKGPAICFDMPLYPQLDYKNTSESSQQITDPRVWNLKKDQFAWTSYIGSERTHVEKYASPALETDLSNMPPTYIMIGTLDMFRDDAIDYAQRLMNAKVPVELHVVPGAFHAFNTVFFDNPLSQSITAEFIGVLKNALNN